MNLKDFPFQLLILFLKEGMIHLINHTYGRLKKSLFYFSPFSHYFVDVRQEVSRLVEETCLVFAAVNLPTLCSCPFFSANNRLMTSMCFSLYLEETE